MRIRRKKWVDPFLEEDHPTYSKHPKKNQGSWKISNDQALHVEIGAGKGDYWLNMATMYPKSQWVAIEKDPTVAAMAIRKSYQYNLTNAKMIIGDAKQTPEWFAVGEIDVLHLNFSDPWPKSGHHKRRLSSHDFLAIYKQLLAPRGVIMMKTDNKKLFEYSLVTMNQAGLMLEEVFVDFREHDHPEDAISEYEQRFIDNHQPIYRAVWRKHD